MKDENSDPLWKMGNLFEILNQKFSKFYSPSEHMAVDKVIVLYKVSVIFRQYIPNKHKRFVIKKVHIKMCPILDAYGIMTV